MSSLPFPRSTAPLLLLLITALLAGCRPAAGPSLSASTAHATVSVSASATTVVPAQAPAAPVASPTALPEPVILPSPTGSPPATATTIPLAVVAVPPDWESAAHSALERLSGSWQWQLQPVDDPQAALAAGEVHLALLPDEAGVPAGARPLAVAVPFVTAWEETSLTQATEILNSGHALAQVIPWERLVPSQKALRVGGLHPGEEGYPLQQPWSLHAAPGYETAAAQLGPALEATAGSGTVHLLAVGDVMLDRALGGAILNGNLAYPFAPVASWIERADIAVANLESSLGDVGAPAEKAYTFQAPPAAAQSLAVAGFDLVTLANNHALDYGPEALLQGIDLLQEQGIRTVGAGADARAARSPALITVNGLRLAFLGYVDVPQEGVAPYFVTESWTATDNTPGVAWAVPEQIKVDVAAARQQADLVVVQLHSGYEYLDPPSPVQMAAAQAAIDAGAVLVIGHHAHILQGVQFYKEGVIVYGLGNFAFPIDGPPETALLNVWLDAQGVRGLEFIPAVIQEGGQPRPATAEEAAAIRQRIYVLSAGLP